MLFCFPSTIPLKLIWTIIIQAYCMLYPLWIPIYQPCRLSVTVSLFFFMICKQATYLHFHSFVASQPTLYLLHILHLLVTHSFFFIWPRILASYRFYSNFCLFENHIFHCTTPITLKELTVSKCTNASIYSFKYPAA